MSPLSTSGAHTGSCCLSTPVSRCLTVFITTQRGRRGSGCDKGFRRSVLGGRITRENQNGLDPFPLLMDNDDDGFKTLVHFKTHQALGCCWFLELPCICWLYAYNDK